MPAQNLLNRRRRRKHPPVRFGGGAATLNPPSPEQLQKIGENPRTETESTDGSGTDPEEFDEFVSVSLSELRSNVQCPICLGIIKKTRTVMGCLHRFCRDCIDKSMRLGNNECPACRMHCASRRSLRDDLDFDAFVSSVYPDVKKYEEEEAVLHEEEKAVNEQIQASIAQISLRQSEAIAKSRKTGASTSRVPRNSRKYSRRSGHSVKSDDSSSMNQDENDRAVNAQVYGNQPEFSQRTHGDISPIQTPCAVDEDVIPDSAEPTAEYWSSPSLVNPDLFTWGRAGVRSHTRYGGASSSKVIRSRRIQKLAEHLANLQKDEHEHVFRVITTHFQNDETLWLKDYRTSDSYNASILKDDLKAPLQVVERCCDELSIENLLFKVKSASAFGGREERESSATKSYELV